MTRASGKQGAESICWQCARADGGRGCPWVDADEAVPGWRVEGRILRNSNGRGRKVESHVNVVLRCPLFVADGEIKRAKAAGSVYRSSLGHMCRWGGLTPKVKR